MSPLNATETDMGRRTYTWTDERYVSVTSIISGGIPKFLLPWGAKLVAEAAYDRRDEWLPMGRDEAVMLLKSVPNLVRDKAANLGSAVHAAAEAHALGLPVPE